MSVIISSRSSNQFVKRYLKKMKDDEVWVIGGSQCVEEGKLVAEHLRRQLVVVPSSLSSDAFFTDTVAVREEYGKPPEYQKAKKAYVVIFDKYLLGRCGDKWLISGWADVLSGITARVTWKQDKKFSIDLAVKMDNIMDDCCHPRKEAGLFNLFYALKNEVALCDEYGSATPEEGLEHQVAYKLERYDKDHSWLHGELVFIGIEQIVKNIKVGVDQISRWIECKHKLGLQEKIQEWKKRIGEEYVNLVTEEVIKEYENSREGRWK